MPGERFAPVMPSAERIEVRSGGRAPRNWLMMIKVAAVGGHGAGWESAGAGADLDCLGEPGRGVAAEFGCVEQPTAIVGEQPSEQHLIAAIRIEGFGYLFPRASLPGMKPDRSASSAGASPAPSRLASGTTTPIRCFRGRLTSLGVRPGSICVAASTGSPTDSPFPSMRCSWVPSNSPVSGSMFSTSSQSDSSAGSSSFSSSGWSKASRPSSRSANRSERRCCSVRDLRRRGCAPSRRGLHR